MYVQSGKRYLIRLLWMMILTWNIHQILNSMPDSDSWFNSAFKTAPEVADCIKMTVSAVLEPIRNQHSGRFFFALTEIENRNWVFSTFLVLLVIGFIFDQFLKAIPVLKSSEPQLSDGCIHFPLKLVFMYVRNHFTFFFLLFFSHFGISDNNFETFTTPLILSQIQHPGTVLNAELKELSESAIEFNFWWRFVADIII